jgi:NADPH-dependent curcumin reductase CurA
MATPTERPINQRWTLAKRPVGEPTDDCFSLEAVPVPELAAGEILVETHYLSLDPYMRGRMRDAKSYAEPLAIGEVITGESAGVVSETRSEKFAVGDAVALHHGWQTHHVVSDGDPSIMPIDPTLAPIQDWLGVVGMPGRTAYFGLQHVGKPVKGETLVVSAASGAVGSVVGQVGKILGLRVVGVAGGPEKCAWCTDELGFDACIDYKNGDLASELAAACPDGVDIYFENVGGAVTRAVAPLLNAGARVPICGFISLYNSEEDLADVETPFHVFGALSPPPEHRFFLVGEWHAEWREASKTLAGWIKDGRLKHRETISEGITSAPAAFRGLFQGENFGKQLVHVAGGAS